MTTDTLIRTRHASEGEASGLMPPLPPETGPSAIMAMHHRYERAWCEYNRVDNYRTSLDDDDLHERGQCAAGMRANNIETTALRRAILYQVPHTDEELTILLYHAHGALEASGIQPRDGEREAIETALETAFDYLLRENRADVSREVNGHEFNSFALHAFDMVRYRTGETKED